MQSFFFFLNVGTDDGMCYHPPDWETEATATLK